MLRLLALLSILSLTTFAAEPPKDEQGFVPLFDGKSLDGWTPQDPALKDAFKVEDGAILTHGAFTHLFYSGPVNDAKFKNFELRAEFKMAPSSNSGIFFHTENPGPKKKVEKGYECQICGDSYKADPRKTGSLYAVEDVNKSAAKEDEVEHVHDPGRGQADRAEG